MVQSLWWGPISGASFTKAPTLDLDLKLRPLSYSQARSVALDLADFTKQIILSFGQGSHDTENLEKIGFSQVILYEFHLSPRLG